jgi:tetratricopeptide (TPR) repeat protein
VDDAFAELDRMTASLESDNEGRGMLLPDEQYADSAPTQEIEAPQHVDALIGRTPESGVPAVEEAPAAFVTETMAELYLQQGFREEALAVYRQLLALNPDDAVLAGRVSALEAQVAPAAAVEDAADLPKFRFETSPARPDALGQSVRAFLGVFARRRAPMRRRAPAIPQPEVEAQPESPLSALFGASQGSDDASAAVLAGAFAAPNGESDPLPGRPTRAAVEELRLGDVFGKSVPASAARAASFDEFFSSGSAEQPAQSPLDEEGSDMVQFTAWLEGLKKK